MSNDIHMDKALMEKTDLHIGFIPLTDCAPLVIAHEKGIFSKYGLNVTLSKETSWANIRDKVAIGILDASQMLAPMPIAMTLGLGAIQKPMITAMSLDLNGNAITVSNKLHELMMTTAPGHMQSRIDNVHALKAVIETNKKTAKKPLTFAVVYPFSAHNYELRYWMGAAGINPDADVNLVVVPPPQMPGQLEAGIIDGYCVGEPWNSMAVHNGIGHTVITSYEIWNNAPEKVLGVTEEWAMQNPETHKALLMALLEACQWVDKQKNRIEVSNIISQGIYVNAPDHIVRLSMSNMYQYSKGKLPESLPNFNIFNRYAANYPWRSHADWFLSQMIRWDQVSQPVDINEIANKVYRPDIYASAASELGWNIPEMDRKTEGINSHDHQEGNMLLGPDLFFDKKVFDSNQIADYLKQFHINKSENPLAMVMPANTAQNRHSGEQQNKNMSRSS
jgi:ABC-type nitrate/sulfonate/bicarbonate transport system substrate-binding protein